MCQLWLAQGVVRISSDRDDRMGGGGGGGRGDQNPKESLDQKLNPQKSHARFLSMENFQKTIKW